MRQLCHKTISGMLVFFVFITGLQPVSFSAPSSVSIPEKFGKIDRAYKTGSLSSPPVYLLLDAHDSIEAQQNIAGMIEWLAEQKKIDLVLEEGFEGKVPTDDFFAGYKDPVQREKVSYLLMDRLRLGGAEFAHINRRVPFDLVGMDNDSAQEANLKAAALAARYQGPVLADMLRIENEIKNTVWAKLPKIAREMIENKKHGVDLGHMPENYLKKLNGAWQGKRTAAPQFNLLMAALTQHPSSLPDIDADAFLKEIQMIESEVLQANTGDKKILELVRDWLSLIQLRRFALLEVSFEEYEALSGALQGFRGLSMKTAADLKNADAKTHAFSRRWEFALENSVLFYEAARQRDIHFRRALQSAAKRAEGKGFVIVCGGFHRKELERALERMGRDYVTVMPQIGEMSSRHQQLYKKRLAHPYDDFEEKILKAAPVSVRLKSALQMLADMPGTPAQRLEVYLKGMTAENDSPVPAVRSEVRTIDETGLDPLLQSGRRTLLFSEQNEMLADEIEARASAAGRPAVQVRIQTQQDIERLLTMTRIEADGRVTVMKGELAEVLENGGVLIIDYAESMAQQAEGFNSAFDKNPYWRGIMGLENVTIVGLTRDERLLDYPNSLYSRFKEKLNFKFSAGFTAPDPLQDRLIENTELPKDAVSWDAFDNPDLDRDLVRQYHLKNGNPAVEPGPLVRALQSNKPLILHRAALTPGTATFRFLREAFRRGYVIYNGEKLPIPAGFRIYLSHQADAERAKNAAQTKLIVSGFSMAPAQKPVFVIHQDNVHMLSQSAETGADGKLTVNEGLLAAPANVRLSITTNLPRHVWNLIMGAGFDEIDAAPWVQIPSAYKDRVQAADSVRGENSANAFDAESVKDKAGILIQGQDEEWIEAEIRRALPGRKIQVHYAGQETGLGDIQGSIVQDGPGQYRWDEGWEILAALQRGEAVVIHRAHAAPALLQALSTALAEQPYLMVNGKREEWKSEGGILIVTDAGKNESERRENIRAAAHVYESNPDAAALRQAIRSEFPSIPGEAWQSLQQLSELFQKIPAPETRPEGSSNLYPALFSLNLKTMRMLARHYEKARSWEAAIEEVVLSHYQDDLEVHDYMLVMARLAMDAYEPAPLRKLDAGRMRNLLNRSTPPAAWDDPQSSAYWTAAAVMDAESLRKSGFGPVPFADRSAGNRFRLIKRAMIRLDMQRIAAAAENIEKEHRQRFAMENSDVSDAPDFNGDWLDEEETETQMQRQLDTALRGLMLDHAVFLQGAPGVGKTYSAGKILEMLKLAEGGLSAQAKLYQMTAGPALRMRDFLKTGSPYSEWEKNGGVLFIDEANLTDSEFWSFLESKINTAAGNGEKRFVVFTGNQNYLPGRNRLRVAEKMTVVQYAAMSDSFIREKILIPLIDLNIQKEAGEQQDFFERRLQNLKSAKADQIIRIHRLFERAAGANVYSARDLQELVLRMNKDADPELGRPAWDEKRMVQTAWQIYSGHLSELDAKTLPYILALWYQIDPDFKKSEISEPLNSEWQSLDFAGLAMTSSVREIADILMGFLKARDQRMQSADYREAGKFGFIQEGPSARLKDELVLTLLKLLGYSEKASEPNRRFIRLTATPDNAEYIDAEIRQAREEGVLVVLSEINLLPSSYIEGRLNDALTGANSKPGFALIGSMNTADFSGRQKLSSALLNRVIYREVPAYTQDEIEQIAALRLGSAHAESAAPLAAFHAWLRSRIEDTSRHPTVRELNDAADLIKQGRSLAEAIEEVYGLIFLEKMKLRAGYLTGEWRKMKEKNKILAEHILQRSAGLIMPPEIGDPVLEITAGETDYGGYRQKFGNIIRIKEENLKKDPFGVLFHEASHGIFTTDGLNFGEADDVIQDLEDLRHLRAFDRFFPRAKLNLPNAYHEFWRSMFLSVSGNNSSAQEEAIALLQQYLLEQPQTSERALFQTTLIFFVMETFMNSAGADSVREWAERISRFGQVVEANKKLLPGLTNNPFSAAAKYLEAAAQYAEAIPADMRVENVRLAQYLANQSVAGVQGQLINDYLNLSKEPLLKAEEKQKKKAVKDQEVQAELERQIESARESADLTRPELIQEAAPVKARTDVKALEKQMREMSGRTVWKENGSRVSKFAAGLVQRYGIKTGLFLLTSALIYWLPGLNWSGFSTEAAIPNMTSVLDHPAFPIIMIAMGVAAAVAAVWLLASLIFPEAMQNFEYSLEERFRHGHEAHGDTKTGSNAEDKPATATFRVQPLEALKPKAAAGVPAQELPPPQTDLRALTHEMDAQLDRLIGDFFARDASVAHVQGGSQINLEMLIQTGGNLEESYEQLGAQEKIDAREIVLFGDLPEYQSNPIFASFLDYLTDRGFVFTVMRSADEFVPGLRSKAQIFSNLQNSGVHTAEAARAILKNRKGGAGRALPIHIQDLLRRVEAQYLASAFLPLQDNPEIWDVVSDSIPAPGLESADVKAPVILPETLADEEQRVRRATDQLKRINPELIYQVSMNESNYWIVDIMRPFGVSLTQPQLEGVHSVLYELKDITRLRALRLSGLGNLKVPAFVNLENLIVESDDIDPWSWDVSARLKNVMAVHAKSFYRPPSESERGVAEEMTNDEFSGSARTWIAQHPNHSQLKVSHVDFSSGLVIITESEEADRRQTDMALRSKLGYDYQNALWVHRAPQGVVSAEWLQNLFADDIAKQERDFLLVQADLGDGEKSYTVSPYVKAVMGDRVVLLNSGNAALPSAAEPKDESLDGLSSEEKRIIGELRNLNPAYDIDVIVEENTGLFSLEISSKANAGSSSLDLSLLEKLSKLYQLSLKGIMTRIPGDFKSLPQVRSLKVQNMMVTADLFSHFPNLRSLSAAKVSSNFLVERVLELMPHLEVLLNWVGHAKNHGRQDLFRLAEERPALKIYSDMVPVIAGKRHALLQEDGSEWTEAQQIHKLRQDHESKFIEDVSMWGSFELDRALDPVISIFPHGKRHLNYSDYGLVVHVEANREKIDPALVPQAASIQYAETDLDEILRQNGKYLRSIEVNKLRGEMDEEKLNEFIRSHPNRDVLQIKIAGKTWTTAAAFLASPVYGKYVIVDAKRENSDIQKEEKTELSFEEQKKLLDTLIYGDDLAQNGIKIKATVHGKGDDRYFDVVVENGGLARGLSKDAPRLYPWVNLDQLTRVRSITISADDLVDLDYQTLAEIPAPRVQIKPSGYYFNLPSGANALLKNPALRYLSVPGYLLAASAQEWDFMASPSLEILELPETAYDDQRTDTAYVKAHLKLWGKRSFTIFLRQGVIHDEATFSSQPLNANIGAALQFFEANLERELKPAEHSFGVVSKFAPSEIHGLKFPLQHWDMLENVLWDTSVYLSSEHLGDVRHLSIFKTASVLNLNDFDFLDLNELKKFDSLSQLKFTGKTPPISEIVKLLETHPHREFLEISLPSGAVLTRYNYQRLLKQQIPTEAASKKSAEDQQKNLTAVIKALTDVKESFAQAKKLIAEQSPEAADKFEKFAQKMGVFRSELKTAPELSLKIPRGFDQAKPPVLFMLDAGSLASEAEMTPAVFDELLKMQAPAIPFKDHIQLAVAGGDLFLKTAGREQAALLEKRISALRQIGFEVKDAEQLDLKTQKTAIGFIARGSRERLHLPHRALSEFYAGAFGVALVFAQNPDTAAFKPDKDGFIVNASLAAVFAGILNQFVVLSSA